MCGYITIRMNSHTDDLPKKPQARWAWVKFQLGLRGLSLADVARELEVGRNAVCNAKSIHYPRVERAIASKLGMKPEAIWPERYKSTTRARRRNPENRRAA